MTAKIVRIDVDTQNGFCSKGGGLYVKGAEDVTPLVALLNEECREKGYVLLGSVDTHTCQDPEFKEFGGIWPVHCVKGTEDWLKVRETLPRDFQFVPMDPRCPPEVSPTKLGNGKIALYFEKNVYSIMDNPHARGIIGGFAMNGYEFEIYGVATDYCVKSAAHSIRSKYPKAVIRVLLYACAGVDLKTTADAIEMMRKARIEVVEKRTDW